MFLKQTKQNHRVYLQIIKGYREDGKVKQKVIQNCGYLDQLEKEYDDPIQHFQNLAKELTAKEKQEQSTHVSFQLNENIPLNADLNKNLGYIYMQKIYRSLQLPQFFSRQDSNIARLNDYMQSWIYTRLLVPDMTDMKHSLFEDFDVSRDIPLDADWEDALKRHLYRQIRKNYEWKLNNALLMFMDDYLENEHIVLSVLLDNNGIPLDYVMYTCDDSNEIDMLSMINYYRSLYPLKNIVVCADREFKEHVIDKSEYIKMEEGFRVKIQIHEQKLHDDTQDLPLTSKEIVYYSPGLLEHAKNTERYEGFYAIATTNYRMKKEEVMTICRQSWKLKEYFCIRSEHTQNLYANTGLQGYVLISFISLVLYRLLYAQLEGQFPEHRLLEALKKCTCTQIHENLYQCNYYDEILSYLDKKLHLDTSKRYRTRKQLRNMISSNKS